MILSYKSNFILPLTIDNNKSNNNLYSIIRVKNILSFRRVNFQCFEMTSFLET